MPPPLPPAAPPPKKRSLLGRALFGILIIAVMAAGGALLMHASIDPAEDSEGQAAPTRHELLAEMKSWGYQLQNVDVATAARSAHDLLVIDEAFEGATGNIRRPEMLRTLKRKPDGGRRLVLAYLSIGEAEDYRPYWDRKWVAPASAASPLRPATDFSAITTAQAAPGPAQSPFGSRRARPINAPTSVAPLWLADENPSWRGNYRVRFWDAGWQTLMFGSETAALERIIGTGFDGVYLDRADVHAGWAKERPEARADMEALIQRIAARARELSPGFIVVMQNAEELLSAPKLRGALDAVAKEDLLFGLDGTEKPNGEADIKASVRQLKKAQRQGLPVLVVEYVATADGIASARQRIEANGFVPYFAPRALDRLQAPR